MARNDINEQLQLYNANEIWCNPDTCFLGQGGSSLVILGHHSKLGFVAIKCFTVNRIQSNALVARVKDEVEMIQRANHESIARVHGWTKWTNNIGILTQYYEGGDLGGIFQMPNRVLKPLLCLRIALETATALAFAHEFSSEKRIIHGDVKPENILLNSDMRCKLADFGAAKLASFTCTKTIVDPQTSARKTPRGRKELTMSYASPEVLINPGVEPKPQQDTFSYGVLLYALISGQQPYTTFSDNLAIKDAVTKRQRPDCSEIEKYKSSLSTEERDIINLLQKTMRKCWQQDPLLRPKMAAVRDELQRHFFKFNPTLAALQAIEAFKAFDLDAPAPEEGERLQLSQFSSRTGTFLPATHLTGDLTSLSLSTNLPVTPAASSSSSHQAFSPASTDTVSTSSRQHGDAASSTPGGNKNSFEDYFDSNKRETALALIRQYVTFVKEQNFLRANRVAGDLQQIAQGQTTADDFRQLGIKLRIEKKYLDSVLILQMSSVIYANDLDSKKAVKGVQLCAQELMWTNIKMIESDVTMKSIARDHVLPLMRDIRLQIDENKIIDEKFRVLNLVWCLYSIGWSEGLINDRESQERSLRKAISLIEKTFGLEASKHRIYAHCLHNLGAVCSRTSRITDAVKYYERALEAYKKAEDHSSGEKKKKDIESTENNLRRNKEKLGK